MQEQQTSGPERSLPTEPTDRWVNDCWFVEVMPPTWTWAYRRLLNAGGDQLRAIRRLA